MKYAVISLIGRQHVVSEGEKLQVDHLDLEVGAEMQIKDVLLLVDEKSVKVGTPLVEKAVVTAKVVSHNQGEKIRVAKFKAKSRYRKVRGHRQSLSTVEIVKIK